MIHGKHGNEKNNNGETCDVFANFENGNKDVYFIFFFFFNQKTNILKEMTRKGKINIIIAIFDLKIRYFSNNKCKV